MELHIFSNLGGIIESSVIQPAQKIAMSLSGNMIPFVGGGLSIWVIVYGLATVRGAVHTPVNDFVWRVAKISLILSIGMAGGIFQPEAYGFYNAISNAIYNAINLGSGGACPVPSNDPMGVYGALDCASGQMFTPFMKCLDAIGLAIAPPDAGVMELVGNFFQVFVPAVFCFLMLGIAFLGTIALLVYTGFEVISTRVLLALAFAVSPLFIFALAFEPIKSLFSNWLNVLIKSIVFQALFIAFIGIAFGAITNLTTTFLQVAETTDLMGLLVTVIVNSISFVIMIGIFVFTATRIQHLAAELASGGAGGPGLGTLLTAMATKSVGKWASGKFGGKKPGGQIDGSS